METSIFQADRKTIYCLNEIRRERYGHIRRELYGLHLQIVEFGKYFQHDLNVYN